MVLCKFFLQGNCKFGDYCKNEHQLNDDFSTHQTQQNSSILRQSHFGNQFQAQNTITKGKTSGTVDVNTLVKSVVNDMTIAEKGGQWLLSCYAPFKDKQLFPGFEDQSFEEIRLGYDEAKNNGTLEQYKQQLNLMLQQAMMRLKSLQNPSLEIVNILKTIYHTPVASQTSTSSNPNIFGNNTSGSTAFSQKASFGNQGSSIFAQASQSMFGKPQEQSNTGGNIFGGTNPTNVFGSQANNLFTSNQNQTPSGSIFGQNNTNASMQNTNSIFGQPAVNSPVQSGSIFGGSSSSSSFGATNNIFLGNQSTNVFGQSPQSTSIFGSQNSTVVQQPNLFTTSPSSQPSAVSSSMFGMDNSQKTTNVFATPINTQSQAANIFGSQSANSQQTENMFGTPPPNPQPTNLFGIQNSPNLQPSPSPSIFGSSQNMPTNISQPKQTPLFVSPSIPNPHNNPSPNIFGAVANTEVNPIFQQNISNSPFAKTSAETQLHSTNIFGTGTFTNLTQQQNEPIEEEIYSKLEDLTEEEIKWFESDDLNNFNIPEKPPTYEMCFKA